MMSPILLIAGRFLLASALLMALYWAVWRKQATYRAKRMYLLTMPIVAIIIALLQVEVYKPEPIIVEVSSNEIQATRGSLSYDSLPNLLPKEGVNSTEPLFVSSEALTTHTESATYEADSDTSLPSHGGGKEWDSLLIGLTYILIIGALFVPFVFSLYQVHRLRKEVSIRKTDNEHDIHILMGSSVKAPFSFHRTIFMPQALTEAQSRMILTHEKGHILHRHYIDVWVSETVTRLLWWNPFLWWARAELRNVHEFEADSEVLATGEDVLAYQTILIEEVLHGDIIIANGFNHSFIRRRFVEMLQSTNHRMTSRAKAGTAVWMLLMAALMCCTVGEAETVYKVKSDELQVTIDGAFNTGEKVVRFNHRYVVEKDLDKRDSLMWAHAYSIPADFNISIGMKSKEEQKLFERFMMIWSIIVDYNGWLERGEYPISPDSMEMSEEEKRNGLLKSKELYRDMLMQRLSQINTPLRDTLNQFLEKFGLDFVLPKGKGFRVRYKNHKGEPAFLTRPEQKKETTPADSGQWHQAKVINPRDYLPEVLSQIGNLNADAVVQLLSTAASVQELTPEQYEELKKTMPNKNLPSLDSINSNAREIKKAIETIMLEGMTGMQTAIVNNIREAALKPGEVENIPMTVFEEPIKAALTLHAEDVAIDTSYQAQNEALMQFMSEWFDLSENAVHHSKSGFDEKYKDFPKDFTYEDYNKGWNGTIILQVNLISKWLNKLNSEIRLQVEALLKQHGWVIPRDKEFLITIESKAFNKTWTFVKRPRSSQIFPPKKVTEKELEQMKIAARREKDYEVWRQIQRCFTSWAFFYSSPMGASMEEYEMVKKMKPDLPEISEVRQNKELSWTVKQLYIEHLLKGMDEKIANQVREAIKLHSTDDYLEREILITIDLGEQNGYFKKEKGKEQFGMTLLPKKHPLPEEFLPAEKAQAATNTSANESSITNDASLREQDEALRAFFRGWFDMNKMSQTPILTKKEFQQAIKTEPIPPGFDPSYKAYKERIKNNIAEAEKKMEEARARLNKEIRPQVEAVLNRNGKTFPPERQLKIIIRAAYKNATWEFENTTHPNAYGCAVNTNFMIVDDPSSPDYQ